MRLVSLPVVYNQSYGIKPDGSPDKFSETFSLYRILISRQNTISIKNIKTILFSNYRKRGGDATPKLCFFIKKNFESRINLTNLNFVGLNSLVQVLNIDGLKYSPSDIFELPLKFSYFDVGINSISDFAPKSIYGSLSGIQKISIPLTQYGNSIVEEVELVNSDLSDYLYVLTYCPILLQTEVQYSGHIILNIE